MPRKSIGETAMTDAERQARYRAARAAGKPVVRVRRAFDHRGRARRWTDHVAGLVEAQVEYAAWLDSLPRLRQGLTNPHRHRAQRLAPVGPQEPPARRCVSLSMGTPRRAGPPYGLPAQATTQGGQFWTPIGGQYSTPVDTLGVVHVLVAGQPPKHRLTHQPRQPVATVLAAACVR
jgi:hypothetical protein